jgi:hypothetical protein
MFELKFYDNSCRDSRFTLVDSDSKIKVLFKLNLVTEYNLLSKLIDLKTTRLVQLKEILDKKVLSHSMYDKYNKINEENYYIYLEKNRILKEATYNSNIINNIIEKRKKKYIVPVL